MTIACAGALVLLLAQPQAATTPPAAQGATQPPPPAPAAASSTRPDPARADVWLVIYNVLPDRTTEFEALARQVRDALAASAADVRKAQARELRVYRSALPNAEGRAMYFLQVPALTGDADRTGLDVLIDAVLPEQATALKKQLASVLDPANPSGNALLLAVK